MVPFLGSDVLPQETTWKAEQFLLWQCLREHDDDYEDDEYNLILSLLKRVMYITYLLHGRESFLRS